MSTGRRGRAAALALLAAVTAAAVLPALPRLHLFFGQWDDLVLIEGARVESPRDLAGIFTRPLHAGNPFEASRFQRPVYQLSYAADLALWGLRPFGYNLTNLLLHLVAVWLAWPFAARLTGRPEAGPVAALLFALSPVHPAIVGEAMARSDILPALFWMAAFLAYDRHRRTGRPADRALALLFFVLAVWSKETAYLFLPFLFAAVALRRDPSPDAAFPRWRPAVRAVAPFAAAAAVLAAWHVVVVGPVGAYVWGRAARIPFEPAAALLRAVNVVKSFVLMLVVRGGGEREFFSLFPGATKVLLYAVLVAVAATLAWRLSRRPSGGDAVAHHVTDRTPRPVAGLAWAACLGLVAAPAISAGLEPVLAAAYAGRGPAWITKLMLSRDMTPLAAYRWKLRELVAAAFAAAFVAVLAWARRRRWTARAGGLAASEPGFTIAVGWLLAFLALHVGLQDVEYWYMYIPALAFSVILSIAAAEGVQGLASRNRSRGGGAPGGIPRAAQACALGLAALLVATWPSGLRLGREEAYRDRLSRYADALVHFEGAPRDTVVRLESFPVLHEPGAYPDGSGPAEEGERNVRNFLRWSKLAFAERGWSVEIGSRTAFERLPKRPRFSAASGDDGALVLAPGPAADPGETEEPPEGRRKSD